MWQFLACDFAHIPLTYNELKRINTQEKRAIKFEIGNNGKKSTESTAFGHLRQRTCSEYKISCNNISNNTSLGAFHILEKSFIRVTHGFEWLATQICASISGSVVNLVWRDRESKREKDKQLLVVSSYTAHVHF